MFVVARCVLSFVRSVLFVVGVCLWLCVVCCLRCVVLGMLCDGCYWLLFGVCRSFFFFSGLLRFVDFVLCVVC